MLAQLPFLNASGQPMHCARSDQHFPGDDDLVCIWNIGEKELVRTIRDHEATIFSLAFSPDGNILLTSDTAGRCKVWAAQPNHSLMLAGVEEAHDLGKHQY